MNRLICVMLLACGPQGPPVCETVCNTRAYISVTGYFPDSSTNWTCDNLQYAESVFVSLVADKYPNACSGLDIELTFKEGRSWLYGGEKISGSSSCLYGTIRLSSLPLQESSYSHEMLHILQQCKTPKIIDHNLDSNHSDWRRNGFLTIISDWKDAMREQFD